MASAELNIIEVAVFSPVRQVFDYLAPEGIAAADVAIGARIKIPFGRSKRIGIVLKTKTASRVPPAKLRRASEILDEPALIDASLIGLIEWAAAYYHHPIGDAYATALPSVLKRGANFKALSPKAQAWQLSSLGREHLNEQNQSAPRRAQVLECFSDGSASVALLVALDFDWRRIVRALVKKSWLVPLQESPRPSGDNSPEMESGHPLNSAQTQAVDQVCAISGYQTILLDGVTGSGKTEVYMAVIARVLERGQQALMLVPEIGLTEQLLARFRARFGHRVGVMHSGLSENERARTWHQCQRGGLSVILGTRSAVWLPFPKLGLVVVDEEHDLSFKQQEGMRYSARDCAIVRAQQADIPIILGSATPSLESLLNVKREKYAVARLPERAGGASMPALITLDIRGLKLEGGLSDELVRRVKVSLANGEQALMFINRRGYAPTMMCHRCGWVAVCGRCDARLVFHQHQQVLVCHHCGGDQRLDKIEPCCRQPDWLPLGLGTERIEEALLTLFPGYAIARIDRDSMRRKGALESKLAEAHAGKIDILIGTQLLAKGHDFSNVTIVGVVDADSRLYSTDFRAEERLAQTILQVAGRAGRGGKAGTVIIQTHHPQHPVLRALVDFGYPHFAKEALRERETAGLPPFRAMAMIYATATGREPPLRFLREIRSQLLANEGNSVELDGPIPAAMARKAGKYRAYLILNAPNRVALAQTLNIFQRLVLRLKSAASVRWSIDVDPQDTI